jgi:cob(I)alamin adenosyltransferase
VRIYTRLGDDGSTGLFRGGRVSKHSTGPEAYGAVDEAVAALGVARAEIPASDPMGDEILRIQRELFVVAAELATAPANLAKLEPGVSRVDAAMIEALEVAIDRVVAERGIPAGFVVPGETRLAATLDLARAVVRRAERRAVAHVTAGGYPDSLVVPYLNRLADYLYVLVRAAERSWTPSRNEEET